MIPPAPKSPGWPIPRACTIQEVLNASLAFQDRLDEIHAAPFGMALAASMWVIALVIVIGAL